MGMLLRRYHDRKKESDSELDSTSMSESLDEKPTADSTVTEIKDYLTSHGIAFDAKLTKDKLLELVV